MDFSVDPPIDARLVREGITVTHYPEHDPVVIREMQRSIGVTVVDFCGPFALRA